MAKRKEDEPKPGAPAWQSTFADLMNLLLCFFVLLFSMSSINEEKYELIVASFSKSTFSIFEAGSSAIGDGVLVSNGVSQLNELSDYINSMGLNAEGDEYTIESEDTNAEDEKDVKQEMTESGLKESEELAERIQEALEENNMDKDVDIDFTSQYVQLTLKGSILFDSGSVVLKEECLPVLDLIGVILERYATSTIEIEGHTDNVPMNGAKYSNNDELSDGRALSVFNYLIDTTLLDPATIKHTGRGEYVPVADNSTAEGRAKNRRVEIKIYNSLNNY
ncbi:MAG: flagellar motor protein MotB [Lachnospiraceae bacterium]|nr:flagellar motor protein MotB [Lachnospiraceae bacterium]